MIVSKIGLFPTFNIGFGISSVRGLSLVPKPLPLKITLFLFLVTFNKVAKFTISTKHYSHQLLGFDKLDFYAFFLNNLFF